MSVCVCVCVCVSLAGFDARHEEQRMHEEAEGERIIKELLTRRARTQRGDKLFYVSRG